MKDITKEEFNKPWLAVRVVALLGNGVPVKTIQRWADRGTVVIENPTPGRHSPRLYSLANALQLHGMYAAYEHLGLTAEYSKKIGQHVVQFALDSIKKRTPMAELDEYSLCYWIQDKKVVGICLTTDNIQKRVAKFGQITKPTERGGIGHGILGIGGLTRAVIFNYLEIKNNKKLNQLALEGKLKPFPKHLS